LPNLQRGNHAKGTGVSARTAHQSQADKLSQPSGLSEQDKVKLAATVIQRAVRNGLTEVQVYRFPNSLCDVAATSYAPLLLETS
jgi:hypothetical protein